jgi:hypothetical protein
VLNPSAGRMECARAVPVQDGGERRRKWTMTGGAQKMLRGMRIEGSDERRRGSARRRKKVSIGKASGIGVVVGPPPRGRRERAQSQGGLRRAPFVPRDIVLESSGEMACMRKACVCGGFGVGGGVVLFWRSRAVDDGRGEGTGAGQCGTPLPPSPGGEGGGGRSAQGPVHQVPACSVQEEKNYLGMLQMPCRRQRRRGRRRARGGRGAGSGRASSTEGQLPLPSDSGPHSR